MLLNYIIKINTLQNARIALLSDYDKLAVYRNKFTSSYVIYPEGGDIKRFLGYVGKWIPRYFVAVSNNELMFIY